MNFGLRYPVLMTQHRGGPSRSNVQVEHFVMKRHCRAQSIMEVAPFKAVLPLGSDLILYEPSTTHGFDVSSFIWSMSAAGFSFLILSRTSFIHLVGTIEQTGRSVAGWLISVS